jgi:hypothetical protein
MRSLGCAAVGDLQLHTMIAIAIGAGLGNFIFWRYQHWKANRREISLVSDGRGGYHDSLIRKERMFWIVYAVAVVALLAYCAATLIEMR